MLKKIFLLISISFFFSIQAQELDKLTVTGKWKVLKIENKTSPTKDLIEMTEGFEKGIFEFLSDGTFKFSTNSKSKMMEQLSNILNKNNLWIIDNQKKQIRIGKRNENYSTLILNYNLNKSKIIFSVEDTSMVMEMKKIN